jgi:hypothetical protein
MPDGLVRDASCSGVCLQQPQATRKICRRNGPEDSKDIERVLVLEAFRQVRVVA